MLLAALLLLAQQPPAARPAFEAASVKPAPTGARLAPLHGGPGTSSPGELTGAATFKTLLMRAYAMKDYQISGPAWIETDRYQIDAKIPAGAGKDDVARMLQTLLADRFALIVRRETRRLPIYTLAVAKTGPKLKPEPAETTANSSEEPRPAAPRLIPGPDGLPDLAPDTQLPRSFEIVIGGSDGLLYKLWGRRETMQQLADRLSSHLARAVVDKTRLTGQYDFTLVWSAEAAGGAVPRTNPPPDEIDMHSTPVNTAGAPDLIAAVRSQLGLELTATRGPLQILIVAKAEKVPTRN